MSYDKEILQAIVDMDDERADEEAALYSDAEEAALYDDWSEEWEREPTPLVDVYGEFESYDDGFGYDDGLVIDPIFEKAVFDATAWDRETS